MWFVYIVKCRDGTLYTGITNDLGRRIGEHNSSESGAKYTRARRPVELVYQFSCPDRSTASREERRIKKSARSKKLELINEQVKYFQKLHKKGLSVANDVGSLDKTSDNR